MSKEEFDDIGGHITKENESYTVKENYVGDHLVLSSSHLFPDKQTNGHKHTMQDEIFFFTQEWVRCTCSTQMRAGERGGDYGQSSGHHYRACGRFPQGNQQR